MSTDYSNSSKSKDKKSDPVAAVVQKVITGQVQVVQKKVGIGKRARMIVSEMDFKAVAKGVFSGVIWPYTRNMLFDAWVDAGRRSMFKDGRQFGGGHYGGQSSYHVSYDRSPMATPLVSGGWRSPDTRPPRPGGLMSAPMGRIVPPLENDQYLFTRRVDAETVLEMMTNIIEQMDVVTLFEFKGMAGLATEYTDQNLGWVNLIGSQIHSVPQGFILELPAPEPLPR